MQESIPLTLKQAHQGVHLRERAAQIHAHYSRQQLFAGDSFSAFVRRDEARAFAALTARRRRRAGGQRVRCREVLPAGAQPQ